MLLGSALAAIYGLLIGALTFRYDLEGHYFALATLAFAELLRYVFTNVPQLGGASGFFRPLAREYADGPGLAAFQFAGDLPYYYLILGFLTVVTAVSLAINRSQLGYYLFAIREGEQAAAAIGVPTYRYKLLAVSVSAFFTAWPGAFWAMYFNTIRPTTVFELLVNVEILLPAIVGGIGTVLGPIVGSFIVIPVSEFVRQSFSIPGLNNAVYGVILIAIVLYSPKGVVSLAVPIRRTAPGAHRPVGRRCCLRPNAISRRSPRNSDGCDPRSDSRPGGPRHCRHARRDCSRVDRRRGLRTCATLDRWHLRRGDDTRRRRRRDSPATGSAL